MCMHLFSFRLHLGILKFSYMTAIPLNSKLKKLETDVVDLMKKNWSSYVVSC